MPADVVVADANNYYPLRDAKIYALEQRQIESLWVSEQLGRPIIKAYNNLLAQTLVKGGTAPGTPGRIARATTGDAARAKKLVADLINDTSFDVLNAGPLAESWRQQPGTPAHCTELTAPELTPALAAAVAGKVPRYATKLSANSCSAKLRPRVKVSGSQSLAGAWCCQVG